MTFSEQMVDGRRIRMSESAGKPLLLLIRMASHDMGLWDNLWPEVAKDFTVASFSLTVPGVDSGEPRALLHQLAEECIAVARSLGYERFHFFGWHGGAQIGLRLALDFPQHLLSCVLMGPIYEAEERGPTEHLLRLIESTLAKEDIEFYTYFWLLSGVTPEFAEKQFEKISAMVRHRVNIDKERFSAQSIFNWASVQRRWVVDDQELERIRTPLLILVPAYALWPPLHQVRRLVSRIASARLAVVEGAGDLVIYEDPDKVMVAAGPFLRAAARGTPPALVHRNGDVTDVVANGVRTSIVEPAGAEDAIVFLHGWLMSPQIWAASIAALEGRARCLAVWQPAHGNSIGPPLDFSMADWAEWLAHTLDRSGVRRAVLVGHSMGGMLAAAFRDRYPERVLGLALVSTDPRDWDVKDRRDFLQLADAVAVGWNFDLARQCADLLVGESFRERYAAWLGQWSNEVARYDLPGMSSLGRAIATRPNFVPGLASAEVPTLVVHGDDDDAIEVEDARTYVAQIDGARYVEIADCGHCPQLEQSAAFVDALVPFLEDSGLIGAREAATAR